MMSLHNFAQLNAEERARLEEQAAAYALGALDESEAAEFRAHLGECAGCRNVWQEYEAATALLLDSAGEVDARPDVRGRILAATAPTPVVNIAWYRRPQIWLGAVAAAMVLALGLNNVQLRQDVSERDRALASVASGSRLVSLAPPSGPDFGGSLIVGPTGESPLLVVGNLPRVESGQVIQIWLIRGGKPESAGVFSAGERVVAVRGNLAGAEAIALTVEPGPAGSPGPTSAPFVLGKF